MSGRSEQRAWTAGLLMAVVAVAFLGPVWVWAEEATTGNRVFFRGGFAGLNSSRGGELFTDGHNALGRNDDSTGYYVGAGTDLMLTRDTWGLMKGIAVVGEIGVEYKRFSSKNVANSDTPDADFESVR
ncbi:MAG: hypothetical protein C4293_09965 [Nitrospiraceae bacterium]